MDVNSNGGSPRGSIRKAVPEKLQDALIRLSAVKPIASLSVAALCREAGVSRSSFYLYYSHMMEVYDDVVERMIGQVNTFHEQVGCRQCLSGEKAAFCEFVRQRTDWRGVFLDNQFLPTYVKSVLSRSDYDYLTVLKERGLTQQQAETLLIFQMSGCFAIAMSQRLKANDMAQMRTLIDRFIRAGHDGVCSRVPKGGGIL